MTIEKITAYHKSTTPRDRDKKRKVYAKVVGKGVEVLPAAPVNKKKVNVQNAGERGKV